MDRYYETTAVLREGAIRVDDREGMQRALRHWPDGAVVVGG